MKKPADFVKLRGNQYRQAIKDLIDRVFTLTGRQPMYTCAISQVRTRQVDELGGWLSQFVARAFNRFG